MNRTNYFNYIEEKLNTLAYRIGSRSKLNLLELNIHSENFFACLCNIIYDLELENLNFSIQNIEGIDLIDYKNKILVQVSSTCTKTKIESSLSKKVFAKFKDYSYKFMSISKNASASLRNNNFKNPYNMNFNPQEDIWDIQLFLKKILAEENLEQQRDLYNFIKAELGQNVDPVKIESNLAKVINILAEETLDINVGSLEINPFAIEDKISFNDLEEVKDIIDDYTVYYHTLDKIYSEFDKEGKNKSFSVLQEIRRQYIELNRSDNTPTHIFYEIINSVMKVIVESSNYIQMPMEELQMCTDILVVDAFIRCKIFKNPEGYNHVITR
ncbi:ABC-three component system protein [Atopobacter phocae]|uniref:ABC-three component system protein n=1 Tax=Atopobacter phocae TaxID=136492 RepID=UPI0004704CD1|nr:ABC-three component system protein [Atopobacter phocae]